MVQPQIGSVTNVYKKANGNSNNADLIIFNIYNGASNSGTIVSTPQAPGATEQYSIDYLRVDGSSGSDDPQIKMNPVK